MFEKSPNKHPVQTFQFWFIVLCSFLVVSAWKLDFFTATSKTEVTSSRVFEDVMPPPPKDHLNSEPSSSVAVLSPSVEVEPQSTPVSSEETHPIVLADATSVAATQIKPSDSNGANTLRNLKDPAEPGNESHGENVVQTAFVRNSALKLDTAKQNRPQDLTVASVNGQQDALSQASAEHNHALNVSPKFDLSRAERLVQRGDDVAALRLYSEWYWTHTADRHLFQERMNMVAGKIYFQSQPHYLEPYILKFNEKLEDVAAKHHLTVEYLVRMNRIEPRQTKPGQVIKVLNGPFSVVIDMSDMDLTVHSHGYYLARMPIGLGDQVSLHPGQYKVGEKIKNPAYVTDNVNLKNGDPKNPLGSRLLSLLDDQGRPTELAIHGTNSPELIGQIADDGCIKLANREVETLFDLVALGAEVVIKP